jgi:hypothetical protein
MEWITTGLDSIGPSHAAVALITGIIVAAGTLILTKTDDDVARRPAPAPRVVDVELTKPDKTKDTITIPAAVAKEAAVSDVADHDGLKTETPPGVPLEELEAARDQQDQLAENDQLPIVTPNAAPSQRGCTSRFVKNHSSRRGVRPRLLVTHYTVSANRPGWDDIWAIANLFNTASFAASSHYIIDADGHCAYIVRESDKAWTQATANPVSISIEVINSGREKVLAKSAGLKKIGLVWSDAARRWDIPLQQGRVSGCRIIRPGIIDHRSLGVCGGGHVDVSPFSLTAVVAAAKTARGGRTLTNTDRVTCRKLTWWRTNGRPGGQALKNAIRRRKALESRNVICNSKGPHLR